MPDAVVIGAGPAGLAAAQRLKASGLKSIVFDKADAVGSVWRRHYDRLHLHTPRAASALPGMPMPATFGRYPTRAQFIDYLENYAAKFDLRPEFNVPVHSVRRDAEQWRVDTGAQSVTAPIVVIATGWADFPNVPEWPGMSEFDGPILHSSAYRESSPFIGQRVLVVGFGNSGSDIALELCQSGAKVTIAVRSPVRILPRDLLGIPILTFALAEQFLPARLADVLNAPFIRLATGSIASLGLKQASKGPLQMIEEDGRVPVLDTGVVARIRAGDIRIRGAIKRFAPQLVVFEDGAPETFDAVILATGFKPDLRSLLPDVRGVLDSNGRPLVSDRPTAQPGLYFVGALASPTGQLRQINIGATRIADVARRFLRDESGKTTRPR